MRSTSVKSFVVTLVLFFTFATTAPAAPRHEPRDKQETAIVRFQTIIKRLVLKLTRQDTIEISIPKP